MSNVEKAKAPTPLDDYMTPPDLCAVLGVCKRTLDRWRTARKGPPRTKIGQKILYRKSGVSDWLRRREDEEEARLAPRRLPKRT
jgi:hypothetical protein